MYYDNRHFLKQYIFVGDPEKSSDSMISVIRDSMFNVI